MSGAPLEQLAEVVERVERALLVGDDVGIADHEEPPVGMALHGARQPWRSVSEIVLGTDNVMRRRPEVVDQGLVAGSVVDEPDLILTCPLEPPHEQPQRWSHSIVDRNEDRILLSHHDHP